MAASGRRKEKDADRKVWGYFRSAPDLVEKAVARSEANDGSPSGSVVVATSEVDELCLPWFKPPRRT
jgi:hypothetical protein